MDFQHITYEVDGKIALITLNRPDNLNAWTVTMMNELIQALDLADNDDTVRAIIVTGAGRAFCAGADLSAGRFDENLSSQPSTARRWEWA